MLDPSNAKLFHAKGLAFQSEAEKLAQLETRDFSLEDELVNHAIALFGQALVCDDTFVSSMFHQGLMFRRVNNFSEALR